MKTIPQPNSSMSQTIALHVIPTRTRLCNIASLYTVLRIYLQRLVTWNYLRCILRRVRTTILMFRTSSSITYLKREGTRTFEHWVRTFNRKLYGSMDVSRGNTMKLQRCCTDEYVSLTIVVEVLVERILLNTGLEASVTVWLHFENPQYSTVMWDCGTVGQWDCTFCVHKP